MSAKGLRVLVIEDEALIRLELEDMLADLGCEIAGSAGNLDTALKLVDQIDCDIAVLDINLANQRVDAVVDRLVERGIPFLFTTGYGERGQPGAHPGAPLLEKPYAPEALDAALARLRSRWKQNE
jgi:two-component SAPR family response regulator